jgi:hypothetical protein
LQTPLETLTLAQDLIRDPRKWTKGYFARNERGTMVEANSQNATCWCAVGAVLKVSNYSPYLGLSNNKVIRLLSQASNDVIVPHFNDNPDVTHGDIMAMFNRAKGLAREQQTISA